VEIQLQFEPNQGQLSSKSPQPSRQIPSHDHLSLNWFCLAKDQEVNKFGVRTLKIYPVIVKISNSCLKTYIQYMPLIIGTFCSDNYNIEGNVVWQPLFFCFNFVMMLK
jgi:hypothetical protein